MSIDKVGGSSVIALQSSEAALATQLGGDTNAQVAAMMLKHGHEKRTACRQMRHSEENRLRSFEDQKVAKLREQAEQLLAAGQRRAWGKIASGGLQIAAGAVTISSASSAGVSAEAGAGTSVTAAQASDAASATRNADGLAAGLRGAGGGAEGGMDLWAVEAEDDARHAEIASTVASNKAEETKRRMEDLKDDEQSARELIRSAFDFVKGVSEKQAEINRAAIFNRV